MLEEVLRTISKSKSIDNIAIVSKDEDAMKLGKQFGALEIYDNDQGVNTAISLADKYLSDKGYDCSVIFPQDIPIMEPSDIDNLLSFLKSSSSVIIVPSLQFNGTNALVRCPANIMETQYDRGSYSYQLKAAKTVTQNVSIAFIRRIMLDIDDDSDLQYMIKQNEKPEFIEKVSSLSS
jgi:2-phospho-L-lactate guanylyltransferase